MDSNSSIVINESFQQRVLDLSLNGIYVYDIKKGTNLYINKEYQRLTGYSLSDINAFSQEQFFYLFHENDQAKIARHMQLVSKLDEGEFLEIEYQFKKANGEYMWCHSRDGVFSANNSGQNTQFMGAFVDITSRKLSELASAKLTNNLENLIHERTAELEKSVKKQEILMREIHHRVKNNLQLLSSFFSLYLTNENNPKVINAIQEGISRIHSLSLVYKNLCQTNDLTVINFGDYLKNLCTYLEILFNRKNTITSELNIDDVQISVDQSVTCGLIVNELITNTYKHAFNGISEGKLKVSLKRVRGDVKLVISDNGAGLPPKYDVRGSSSFGMDMVHALAEQMDASIDFKNKKGLSCTIIFTIPKEL